MSRSGAIAAGLCGGAVLAAADQFTKHLAVLKLKDAAPVPLISGVLELCYVENRGMAFGLLQDARVLFLIMTALICLILGRFYLRLPQTKRFRPAAVCLIFIFGGAIGNLIDRMRLGYVVDFVYIRLIDFPVFNLADIFVTWPAVLLVILGIFYYKKEDFERIGL